MDPWRGGSSPYTHPRPLDLSQALIRAERSKKLATWGLALSLLWCVPFAPVVGLGLGIAALVRGGDGQDHGRGRAVAAVVIGSISLLITVVLLAVGIVEGVRENIEGPERDESGQLEDPGEIFVDELRVGDCVAAFERVEDLAPGDDPTGLVTVVRCDEPHLAEVFHRFTIDPDDYSSQSALDRAAEDGCIGRFGQYVGKDYLRSTLELNYYSPNKGEGLFEGDRVICLVTGPSLSTHMLEGSRQ